MAMLLLPVVRWLPATAPNATLFDPVLLASAETPMGRVVLALGVRLERLHTDGRVVMVRVVVAVRVANERKTSRGCVVAAGDVVAECCTANCCVVDASCEAEQGGIALGSVLVKIAPVRRGVYRLRHRRKREARQREREEKQTEPQRRPAN